MARGSIVKRPSGQWAIRYYAGGKRRYETIGLVRKDAERALTARLRELDTDAWREPSDQTLREYALEWLEQRDPASAGRGVRTRLARSTFDEYRRALELHVLPALGSAPLRSLRTADVDAFVRVLERERKPGTVRNVLTPLRKLLADAARQGLIPANPAARADLPPAQDFAGKELPLEHTRVIREALIARAPADPLRPGECDLFYVHLFDVALATGLRLGELRALRWRDVDRERRLLRVERAYSRAEPRPPKTEAGVRAVPIFASAEAALQALAGRALERGRYAPDELVFATAKGTPIPPSHLNAKVWKPALQRAELGAWSIDSGKRVWRNLYRFHDLRHTCVSRLVAAGADVKLVQAVAGHASPLITLKRYSHLLDARVTEAAARFDPAGSRALHGH